MTTGWTCPSCGRGVAPTEKTCDHGAPADVMPPSPYARRFVSPIYEFGRARMPICGCPIGSACGSTACPHRLEVTCGAGVPDFPAASTG